MSAPPREIHTQARRLCQQVVPGSEPFFVDIAPVPGIEVNDCFGGLPGHVKKHGGKQLIGWAIWEWPNVFIEAEFHSIWLSPGGKYIDITPKQIPYKHVLFLPDPLRQYEGFQVDNVRVGLRPDPEVQRFIELAELIYQEMNKGDLKFVHGKKIKLSRQCADYMRVQAALHMKLMRNYGHFLMEAIKENTSRK